MDKLREAAQAALDALEYMHTEKCDYMRRNNLGDPLREDAARLAIPAMYALRIALAAEPAQPVAWRDHVEQRLRTWRQRFVNRSGDQLALDDFMDAESLEDLIDFVCDEWSAPQPPADVPLLTIAEIKEAHLGLRSDQDEYWISFARAVEAEVRRRMGVV